MSPEKIDAHIMQCPYFGGKDTINRKKLVMNTSTLETVHWSGIIGRYARVTLACAQKCLEWEGEPMSDLIDRQAAIDALNKLKIYRPLDSDRYVISDCLNKIVNLPSAQSERTCVNCGRTANNGGWYADGRTRCPIEEHYALPKDGYCHLWEKRNVTDDDYPERREE